MEWYEQEQEVNHLIRAWNDHEQEQVEEHNENNIYHHEWTRTMQLWTKSRNHEHENEHEQKQWNYEQISIRRTRRTMITKSIIMNKNKNKKDKDKEVAGMLWHVITYCSNSIPCCMSLCN
jgi:hypothetical protein